MNKRILFGVLFLALGATFKVSLKAKIEKELKVSSSSHSWQSPPKRESDSSTVRPLIGSKSRDEITQAEPRKSRAELVETAAKLSRELQGVAETLKKSSEEKPTRRPAPKRSTDGERTVFTEALQSQATDITKPTTVTTASGQTKVLQPGTVYFSEPLDPAAITTKADKKRKTSDDSKALIVRQPSDIIEAKPSTGAYARLGVSPDASDAEIKKAYLKQAAKLHPDKGGDPDEFTKMKKAYDKLIDPEQRKAVDAKLLEGKKSQSLLTGPDEKKLIEGTPISTAIVPYTGKPSALITTSQSSSPDEGKPGMSGKKKAAIAAGVVGASSVGAGAAALGAGLIGAGAVAVGVGMSGDKDKPAPEIAPERVEDIKGLDAGSGLDQSFEASPIN